MTVAEGSKHFRGVSACFSSNDEDVNCLHYSETQHIEDDSFSLLPPGRPPAASCA